MSILNMMGAKAPPSSFSMQPNNRTGTTRNRNGHGNGNVHGNVQSSRSNSRTGGSIASLNPRNSNAEGRDAHTRSHATGSPDRIPRIQNIVGTMNRNMSRNMNMNMKRNQQRSKLEFPAAITNLKNITSGIRRDSRDLTSTIAGQRNRKVLPQAAFGSSSSNQNHNHNHNQDANTTLDTIIYNSDSDSGSEHDPDMQQSRSRIPSHEEFQYGDGEGDDSVGHLEEEAATANGQEEEEEEDNEGVTHAIREMEQALKIQQKKYGNLHSSISHSYHALALEYRLISKFDTAIVYTRKALDVVEGRLDQVLKELDDMAMEDGTGGGQKVSNGPMAEPNQGLHQSQHQDQQQDQDQDRDRKQRSSSKYAPILTRTPNATTRYTVQLLTEKSVLFSSLANIYKSRRMYKEAMDSYVEAVNVLVEAGYPGTSRRVEMLLRIMKRVEILRRGGAVGKVVIDDGEDEDDC